MCFFCMLPQYTINRNHHFLSVFHIKSLCDSVDNKPVYLFIAIYIKSCFFDTTRPDFSPQLYKTKWLLALHPTVWLLGLTWSFTFGVLSGRAEGVTNPAVSFADEFCFVLFWCSMIKCLNESSFAFFVISQNTSGASRLIKHTHTDVLNMAEFSH